MREILFRGKRWANGEWVEGYYAAEPYKENTYNCGYILKNENYLFTKKAWLVDSRTVGQYTGLNDKTGRKIFEGDIIKIVPDCDYSDDYSISKVYSYNGVFCVDYHGDDFDSTALGFLEDYLSDGDFEVIGNIHDNPELLEVKE